MARSSPRYLADFDSASGMVRALAAALHGQPFFGLGLSRALAPLAIGVNALPLGLRKSVYAWSGWAEAIAADDLNDVRAEAIAEWVVRSYPRRRYPAAVIGSSNGAMAHLCAALGIPWLPQTFLVPLRARGIGPDAPQRSLAFGREAASALLDANPDLQLHHMHDGNQDRLMTQLMTYFRVKRLTLGPVYRRFLDDVLEPGAPLFVLDCRLSWPVTRMGARHVFQHGGFGGIDPEDYISGSPRVARFLAEQDADLRRWDSPQPDEDAPEAEWGFAPTLWEDCAAFARARGLCPVRVTFDDPEDPSPLVADLHRWWYDRLGHRTDRLVVSSFILADPWTSLRAAAVPFWTKFPVESSAAALEGYLDARDPFAEIGLMLFSHGVPSVGHAPIARWQRILARAGTGGRFLGVSAQHYPADFATFARYQPALSSAFPPSEPPPPRLSLGDLRTFLRAQGQHYRVDWDGF